MSIPDDIRDPFPGLRPFEAAESDRFFGRDLQIRELGARLETHHLVAIIGGSGCGKSSLVRAGLLPLLAGLGMHGAGRLWQPVVFVPGRFSDPAQRRSPLFSLARALDATLVAAPEGERDARLTAIVNDFDTVGGFGRLVDAYSHLLKVPPGQEGLRAKTNFLFVIDQFEELFSEELRFKCEPASMIARVVENFRKPNSRAFVILTMRSENLEACTAYEDFPEVINATSYLVRRLKDSELLEAIVRPVQQWCTERAIAAQAEAGP